MVWECYSQFECDSRRNDSKSWSVFWMMSAGLCTGTRRREGGRDAMPTRLRCPGTAREVEQPCFSRPAARHILPMGSGYTWEFATCCEVT
jgi:hypothetical protein